MTVNYSNILHDTLIQVRDILRSDATLCGSTILNLSGGTTQAYNYIFAGRPNNQRKGFDTPRIVCGDGDPVGAPNNYGDNPDGYHEDELTFQISIWRTTGTNMGFDKRYIDVERIKVLLDNTEFRISPGGFGRFKVKGFGSQPDPDKPETLRNYVIVQTKIIS